MRDLRLYLRYIFKNKMLSLINLFGLALGFSSCIFISMFVVDELSYDEVHLNGDRLYRLTTKIISEGSVDHVILSSAPLAAALKQDFHGVENAVRFMSTQEITVKKGDLLVREKKVYKADQSVFDIFSYAMLKGNPKEALNGTDRVVLTESMAKKYFGTEDPLGKTLTMAKRDRLVTGVIRDVPLNSDVVFSMLTSMDSTDLKDDWFDFGYVSYVLFNAKSLESKDYLRDFESRLALLVDDKVNRPLRENKQPVTLTVHLQRLKGLHFQQPLLYDTPKGNLLYTYIFSAVAALILIIGCLNYINFSIIQSIDRSKEVGIRKVIGAGFYQLVCRYISESFFFTMVSLITGMAIVALLLPFFNQVTSRNFSIGNMLDGNILMIMMAILVVVGILAGSYPAFYTSSIKPVQALKGKVSTPRGQLIRKVSIGAQFFISIGLMICTVIVYRQMNFIRKYDLGFDKDHVINIQLPTDTTLLERVEGFKMKLSESRAVRSVALSGSGAVPGVEPERGSNTMKTDGKEEVRMVNWIFVDQDFLPTMGIQLVTGRNFDGRAVDLENSVLVNEAMVKMMGWKNPLEQQVHWQSGYRNVIGVIRDFHYLSLYRQVEPQFLVYDKNSIANIFVSLSGGTTPEELSAIRADWQALFPDEPFNYKFLDETVQLQYEKEENAMTVFTYFSVLTILISCMGLFGLSSLTIYQRKKEIGIRRIVGAGVLSILTLFVREYIMLIAVAILLVSPLTWIVMDKWLQTFPYRESIHLSVFVFTGFAVATVSMLTIAGSIFKIASEKAVTLIKES